jgi:fructokinase
MRIYGGIEAGGTKFVCAVGSDPDAILDQAVFSTTLPEETIQRAIVFFEESIKKFGELTSIGVASFGPLDPDPRSPTYGSIALTPKPGWSGFDFVDFIRGAIDLPVGFDTDVNGAGLGEWRWGAAQGLHTFVYLTIGHPEMGHIRLPHDLSLDPFPGICPYHNDCLEGLANGPAIEQRWGAPAEKLPPDHPAWELEAHYLALALVNYICTLSPQRIIMGGGVMKQTHLFPRIRTKVSALLNNYVQVPQITEKIDEYIVPPILGNRAGVMGAIALAMDANMHNIPLKS